jgi:hypothetical protein
MFARWTFLMALAGLLGPIGLSSARAQSSEDLVTQYLEDLGATFYTITAVNTDYIANSFPDIDFFEVRFRQYPIAVLVPDGLSASNLFAVEDGVVFPLVSSTDPQVANFEDFFFDELDAVADEDAAAAAGLAWLRLSEAFSQDGFYTFGDPQVTVMITEDLGLLVTGSVSVTLGGRGDISVEMLFDANGLLVTDGISETRTVRPGVRPICQATKLLDADPLVRRMAVQDILVMGRPAAEYLYEQRTKASPELQEAIDRIWQRIVDEGW